MKTYRFTHLIATAFSLAAFSTAGCAEKEKTAAAPLPPAKVVTTTTTTTTSGPGPAPAVPVTAPSGKVVATTTVKTSVPEPITTVPATPGPAASSATWMDIKDHTYDTRAQFFAGLKQLEARVDEQISELTAKRAAMTSTANTKDWDFTMTEMGNARSNLKSTGVDLTKATPETWDQQKDKVGQAWVRTQDAYGKVKSSTTN
jgi:hypothetical protein